MLACAAVALVAMTLTGAPSAAAMTRLGMDTLNIHHCPQVSDATLDAIAHRVPGLQGLIAGYGKCAESYAASHRLSPGGVPIFRCLTTGMGLGMGHEELVAVMARELRDAIPPQRPAFVQAFAIYWFAGPQDVKRVVEGLGPEEELVRPDELATLYRKWQQR